VLVLSDIGLDADGHSLEAPDSGGPAGMVFGHEGNRVLVNGRYHSRLTVRDGAPQRWRIVNAAKSRYFDLDLDGQRFTKIGVDGGFQEYPEQFENVVIAPGERLDLVVSPRRDPRHDLVLRSLLYNRGYGSVEFRDVEDLFTIDFADLPPYTGAGFRRPERTIEPLSVAHATEVRIELTLAQRADGSFEYGINGVPFAKARPLIARLGETQVWTVVNKTKWSHPFHLHGFFFQVLDKNGTPVRPLAWKDTINVPLDQTVQLVVRFDERPGSWMYHCHILDHADGGLMGMVEVGTEERLPATDHHVR
jgi:FtsP/CotA-like multicopper oxidase with cupredoxin domain